MATTILKALTKKGIHAVGSINSIHVDTLAHGAKVTGTDIDNFTLVELAGFNEDGEQLCKQLSDKTKDSYLIASPEQRYLGEDIGHFYNGVDDEGRLIILKPQYTRFETSGYTLNKEVTTVKKGQVAHFDVATQKYIISNADAPHVDFATSKKQFMVVGDLDDTAGNFLKPTVRLMCTKA